MRNLLALVASVGLIGCVGSVDPGGVEEVENPGPNPSGADLTPAKRLFDDNIYPIVAAKCTGGACHSETALGSTLTRFVATEPAKGWEMAINYVALVGNFTDSAPILTRITPDNHYTARYDQTDKDKILEWLAKEVELRNTGGQPPAPTGENLSQAAERVMSAFAGCMTLQNFQQSNMAGAWGNLNSNGGQCRECHTNGGFGFFANNNSQVSFEVLSSKKMFWLQYFTVDLTKGAAEAKVIPNTVSFAGVCNRQVPHETHPTFPCTNNNGLTALQNFYNLTTAALGTGCQPKTLDNI